MAFPTSPIEGQIYNNYEYTDGRWKYNDYEKITEDGLIGHYKFDEGQGVADPFLSFPLHGDYKEMSGRGKHPDAAYWNYASGINGECAYFNGSSDFAQINDEQIFSDQISISLWVKVLPEPGYTEFVSHQGNGSRGFYFGTTSANDGTCRFLESNYPQLLEFDTWTHLVGIFNSNTGGVDMYKNGIKIGDTQYGCSWVTNTSSTGLRIGEQYGAYSEFFHGYMSDLNIFDRALTEGEINELYNNIGNTCNLPVLPTEGLVGHWPLNGAANDTTSNRNNGTDFQTTYENGRIDNNACKFQYPSAVTLTNPLTIFSSSFTIGMWVKRQSATRSILLGDYGYANSTGINLELYETGALRFYYNNAPNFTVVNAVVPFDEWTHVMFIRDKEESKLHVCINGSIIETYVGAVVDKVATIPHNIGRDSRTGAEGLVGLMEDLRIYDRVLNAQEILALAEQTTPIKDSSPYRKDGHTIGQGSSVSGVVGKGMDLSGRSYVIADFPPFDYDEVSLSVWVNPHGESDGYYPLWGNGNFQLRVLGDNNASSIWRKVSPVIYSPDDTVIAPTGNLQLSIGEWHHIAMVYDKNAGNVKTYIDGKIDLDYSNANMNKGIRQGTNTIQLGAGSGIFNGMQDEFRLYNKVLTEKEIKVLYNQGADGAHYKG